LDQDENYLAFYRHHLLHYKVEVSILVAYNQGFINHNYRKEQISLGEFESVAKLMSHTDIATNLRI
jgi:hypothetical protein